MLLAGDIGGTKVYLASYTPDRGPNFPLVEERYNSRDYSGLAEIIQNFLAKLNRSVKIACLGLAGTILEGRAYVTNLSWVVESETLQDQLGLEAVYLLNDLVAVANAIPLLEHEDLHTLNVGDRVSGGAMAVIGPGTGLGEAFLTWSGDRYIAHPTEGGHVDFAATNSREIDLLQYLQEQSDHVSYERICSGIGIPNIYNGYKAMGYGEEPAWLRRKLAEAEDPTPIIVSAALDVENPCELCVATLDTFVSVLGREAGNLALKVLATGGVYIAGGIPPKILPSLSAGGFMQAFVNKGRLTDLMQKIPVQVILNEKAALLGAANFGLSQLE